mgnify:CR=1 FL=1
MKYLFIILSSILLLTSCVSTTPKLTESSSCWEHQTTEHRGQSDHLTLCFKSGRVSLEIDHFDSTDETENTICGQGGRVSNFGDIYYNIDLIDGGCENGRPIGRSILSCQLISNNLTCLETLKNYRVKFVRKNA